MNAEEIIDTIRESTQTLSDIIGVLEDGAALVALGITTEDQDAVEDAHAKIKNAIKLFDRLDAANGSVEFSGKTYAFHCQAELSNRVFNGWWGDAADGESYTAEWSAPAMGDDGADYVVVWQFDEIKGVELEDASGYDWDNVCSVVAR